MRILLTNDDGVTSRGLFAAKQALDAVGAVLVIAPDSNRSGSARSITIDRPLTVGEVALRDGSTAYATDGTPVDCVRFGDLGVVGEPPDLIVSGINYGYNLGDDVTYSGTVAAAFEGLLLGIPGVAISQGAPSAGADFRRHPGYDFGPAAEFLARLVGMIGERGLPDGTVLNVNVPSPPAGGGVCRLGKRIYRDRLELEADDRRAPPLPHLRRRPVVPRRAGHRLSDDRRGPDRGHSNPPRPDQRPRAGRNRIMGAGRHSGRPALRPAGGRWRPLMISSPLD